MSGQAKDKIDVGLKDKEKKQCLVALGSEKFQSKNWSLIEQRSLRFTLINS